ncbi:MAG: hypothetical protein LBQ51_08385 [Desulfovibrio sp.]|jgi:hypothetical protein|nr:hypothetical protein [Desulfovibrio sp.]
MNISSIYSYGNIFQSEEVGNKRNRESTSLEDAGSNRNTEPDTVSFSVKLWLNT